MGIPYFSSWIKRKFPEIVLKKGQLQAYKNINILCLDYNAFVYPCVHKILNKYSSNTKYLPQKEDLEEEILNFIMIETEKFILESKAEKVFIAVDGVCPRAKMIQQRYRRYMSIKNSVSSTKLWDTNAITPGTEFMNKLNQKLKDTFNDKNNIIISNSSESGEGEHKIIRYLDSYTNNNIVISGLDADLILLTLKISQKNNVFIWRQNETTDEYLCSTKLYNELVKIAPIEDLLLIFSLLGNDFLPEIKAVNECFSMQCDKILEAYQIFKNKNPYQRIIDKKFVINRKNFISYLENLLPLEKSQFDEKIIKQTYIHYGVNNSQYLAKDFLKTISWIINYYLDLRDCPDWDYFYPHHISPYIKDIIIYLKKYPKEKICFNWYSDTQPVLPVQQLLFVLPYSSLDLIPNSYIVHLAKTTLKNFYPQKFELDPWESYKPSWHQKPYLPKLDWDYLSELVYIFY